MIKPARLLLSISKLIIVAFACAAIVRDIQKQDIKEQNIKEHDTTLVFALLMVILFIVVDYLFSIILEEEAIKEWNEFRNKISDIKIYMPNNVNDFTYSHNDYINDTMNVFKQLQVVQKSYKTKNVPNFLTNEQISKLLYFNALYKDRYGRNGGDNYVHKLMQIYNVYSTYRYFLEKDENIGNEKKENGIDTMSPKNPKKDNINDITKKEARRKNNIYESDNEDNEDTESNNESENEDDEDNKIVDESYRAKKVAKVQMEIKKYNRFLNGKYSKNTSSLYPVVDRIIYNYASEENQLKCLVVYVFKLC